MATNIKKQLRLVKLQSRLTQKLLKLSILPVLLLQPPQAL